MDNKIEDSLNYIKSFSLEKLQETYFDYALDINGMVGCCTIQILNYCVNNISSGNCYLEVGTFQGMSLIGASLNNKHIKCYGVENFSEDFKDNWENFKDIKDIKDINNKFILDYNIKKYNATNCIHVNEDFISFFKEKNDINGEKVSVYFYDGPHTYSDQVLGLQMAIPVLADEAIIFVDDFKCENVQKSILHICEIDKRFNSIGAFIFPYEAYREGQAILYFKR